MKSSRAQFFLFLETKRAMVGGDDLQVIALQTVPQFFLMPFLSQRRSEDILRSFKTRRIEILKRKIQILRTSLRIDRKPAIACLANFFERFVATQMHDVDRRTRHFGQRDGAAMRFGLGGRRTSERVIFRRLLAFGQRLLHDDIDGAAVFGVHADHAAVLRCGLQSFENAPIVEHEHARICHEQLEAGHALVDQIVHLRKLPTGDVGHDAVKCIVADSLARRFAHPRVERLAQLLAFVLNGEVDQRCGAAERRGPRAGFEIVGAGRSAERHVEMSVNVDAAGEHELVRCIENLGRILSRAGRSDGGDLAIRNGNVGFVRVGCRDHRTVLDDRVEAHPTSMRARGYGKRILCYTAAL